MKSFKLSSGSMVVAILALVVAMSGSAVASSLITSKQIKDGTIQLRDISKSARAALRGATGPAGPQGLPGVVPPDEAFHEVGAAGQPGFENGWVNYDPNYATAAFYKDSRGVVHLKGVVKSGGVPTVFHLPVGYRPAVTHLFPATSSSAGAYVGIDADGSVRVVNSTVYASLEPIEFRAGS